MELQNLSFIPTVLVIFGLLLLYYGIIMNRSRRKTVRKSYKPKKRITNSNALTIFALLGLFNKNDKNDHDKLF